MWIFLKNVLLLDSGKPEYNGFEFQNWETFALPPKPKKESYDWLGSFLAAVIMLIVAGILRYTKGQPPYMEELLFPSNLAVLFGGVPLVVLLLEFSFWKTLLLSGIGILIIFS